MKNLPRAKETEFTEIQKHNAAIHIDTRQLTLTHRKAMNILLWHAWEDIEESKLHSIAVWELCKMLGFHDIQTLYVELKKLPTIGVEWNILRDDGWTIDSGACALMAGFRMVGNRFEYSFFEGFRPLLCNPEIWTKIKIEIANLFTSSYALALYENCIRFAPKNKDNENEEERSTGWRSIEEWKKLLGVPSTDYYNSSRRIKDKILIPAISQVNKLSDIDITPEYNRAGRGGAINKIRFFIKQKRNYRLPQRQKELPGFSKQLLAEQISRFAPGENPATAYLEKLGIKEKSTEKTQQTARPLAVTFPARPSDEILSKLKELGFRWNAETREWKGCAIANEVFRLVVPAGGAVR